MDVFFEQLVTIPKNTKTLLLSVLMWTAGIGLAVTVIFAVALYLPGMLVLGAAAAAGILYLCWRWSGNFSCEFEYIFTNGDLDIDKIIAKQKRERKITINIEATEKICRFDEKMFNDPKYNKRIVACVPDENSVCLAARHKKEGLCLLVFAPEERMLKEISKFIPRNVMREANI